MTLIALSLGNHDNRSAVATGAAIRPVVLQEEGAVEWKPMRPRPLSLIERIAVLLNLPALLIGIPIATSIFHGNDLSVLYAATPFVPLQWFFVGRWVDGQLGYIIFRPRRFEVASSVRRTLTISVCGTLLLLSIASITGINHHRDTNSVWIGIAGIFWFGLMVVMGIRRPRVELTR